MTVSGLSPASFRLDGRVAVVTGAGGKLGPVWVEALTEAGASVACIDLPGASTAWAKDLIAHYGSDRVALGEVDVTSRNSLEAALAWCTETLGAPSILVNNAGIDAPPAGNAPRAPLEGIKPDVWRSVLEVNLVGAFQAAQVFSRPMVAAGSGSIVNVGSLYASVSPDARFYSHLGGDPPFLKPPAYGASKAALVSLTQYLATHWAPHGVRVNALSPGGVRGGQDPEFVRKFTDRVPLGRMAEAGDLKGPLVFLASDAASYVTGFELRVDGGFTAW
ncbi:MAG: SDR family oxidoreductase [Longimicrobiales bacterium]